MEVTVFAIVLVVILFVILVVMALKIVREYQNTNAWWSFVWGGASARGGRAS